MACDDILELDEALQKLEAEDPESADLVKMRFFSGFSLKEIASATGVSYRTIKARWSYARTWLRMEMERGLYAFQTGDKSSLLWATLQAPQTRTYDQAVALLEDIMHKLNLVG